MTNVRRIPIENIRVRDRWRRHGAPIRPPADDMPPLLLAPGDQLLSGWLRLQAARKYRASTLPVITVASMEEAIPLLEEEKPGAFPMQFTDLMRLMDALVEMQRPLLEKRRIAHLNAGMRGESPPPSGPRMRVMLGRVGGWSSSTVGRARPTWEVLRDGNHPLSSLLKDLDAGTMAITTAYYQVFGDTPSMAARRGVRQPPRHPRLQPLTMEELKVFDGQAAMIASIATGVSGYTLALRGVDRRAVHRIPPDRVDRIAEDLAMFLKGIKPIMDALNALKPREDQQ